MVVTILLIVIFCTSSLAQKMIDNPVIIERGRCADILKEMNDSIKCDSLATQLFIRCYSFESGISFTDTQWKGALRFITKKENNQLFCTLKNSMRELDLIGNPIKEAEKRKKEGGADSIIN